MGRLSTQWLFSVAPRWLTSDLRCTPDFQIVGAQRCGTTSLYHYLLDHRYVLPPLYKELHFFDNVEGNFYGGFRRYRSFFPIAVRRWLHPRGRRKITGAATPYYMFHPLVPSRIADMLPGVRLIVLLRDPTARAHSHYQHEIKIGAETLSFEDAVDAEPERLAGEEERLRAEPDYYSYAHHHYSYLARGRYVGQLERLFEAFPREHVLILRSESLYADPAGTMSAVCRFLHIPPVERDSYPQYNLLRYERMAPEMKARLREHFRPYNERLAKLLDEELWWGEGTLKLARTVAQARNAFR